MKKIILVISLLSVMLLTGCVENEKVENNTIHENTTNQQQNVIDSGENSKEDNEEKDEIDDIEKYKLSDSYELTGIEEYIYFNVGVTGSITDTLNELDNIDRSKLPFTDYRDLYNNVNSYDFQSNGKEYNIKCTLNENGGLDWKINDNEVKYTNSDVKDRFMKRTTFAIGVIDLDESDEHKEIVVRESYADPFVYTVVYRINENNELEELISGQLLCVNNKYIFPRFLIGGNDIFHEGPVIGYHTYENGSLVYIDRLLNGEKTVDDNGMLNIDYILEFGAEYGWVVDNNIRDPELEEFIGDIKCKILSVKEKTEIDYWGNEYKCLVYDIELLDDAVRYDYEDMAISEKLPKGTILKDVKITCNEV